MAIENNARLKSSDQPLIVTPQATTVSTDIIVDPTSIEKDHSVVSDHTWEAQSSIPSYVLVVACVFCLVTGFGTIFISKLQNRQTFADPDCPECAKTYYEHPLWQSMVMFIAMTGCLVVDWADRRIARKRNRKLGRLEFPGHATSLDRLHIPHWWFLLPAFTDLTGTIMINFAYTVTYASTVQMLRNSIVLITAFLSMCTVHKALRVFEWIGISVMTFGMVCSGIDSILRPDKATNKDPSKAWIGVVFTLIGTVLNAGTIVAQEWMLRRRYCPPFKAVGFCGLYGVILNGIALPIGHYTGFDNIRLNFRMIGESWILISTQFMYAICSLLFNGSGMIITKVGSALLKGTVYACRAPIMWIFELILGWQGFAALSLVGLILTFTGFFVYTTVIPTPPSKCWKQEVPCFCTRPQEQIFISDIEKSSHP